MRQGDEGLEGVGTSTARVLAETERGLEATGEEVEVSGVAEWVCDGVAASGEVSVRPAAGRAPRRPPAGGRPPAGRRAELNCLAAGRAARGA